MRNYTGQERTLLAQAGIVSAVAGWASLIMAGVEIAKDGPSTGMLLSFAISGFAFLPLVVIACIKVERYGLTRRSLQWGLYILIAFATSMVLLVLLMLITPEYVGVALMILVFIGAYARWPSNIPE